MKIFICSVIFIIWCWIIVFDKRREILRKLIKWLLIMGLFIFLFYQICLKEYRIVDLEKRGIELSDEEKQNIMAEVPKSLINEFGYREMRITKIAYETFHGPGGETTYYIFFEKEGKQYMYKNVDREYKKVRTYVDLYFRWWENIGKEAERNGIEIKSYDGVNGIYLVE